MKLTTLFLALAAAVLATSCQSVSPSATTAATTTPVKLKRGMSKGDIQSALGKPNYKYELRGKETWVYEEGNPLAEKAKEAALNLVPVVGPGASFFMGLNPPTESATAAVSFDGTESVTTFAQADPSTEPATPERKPRSYLFGSGEEQAPKTAAEAKTTATATKTAKIKAATKTKATVKPQAKTKPPQAKPRRLGRRIKGLPY